MNDRYGHATGDAVLARVGAELKRLVRPGDVAARYGGEEIALLLPETAIDEASDVARRVCAVLRDLAHDVKTGAAALRVTLSLGVAARRPSDAGPHDMVARADAALYHTKTSGRDGVAREGPKGFERLDKLAT